eukprot:352237-Chlamydomonas_euryale.AAC.1
MGDAMIINEASLDCGFGSCIVIAPEVTFAEGGLYRQGVSATPRVCKGVSPCVGTLFQVVRLDRVRASQVVGSAVLGKPSVCRSRQSDVCGSRQSDVCGSRQSDVCGSRQSGVCGSRQSDVCVSRQSDVCGSRQSD